MARLYDIQPYALERYTPKELADVIDDLDALAKEAKRASQ